jgi:hypothetical protein
MVGLVSDDATSKGYADEGGKGGGRGRVSGLSKADPGKTQSRKTCRCGDLSQPRTSVEYARKES